MIKLLGPRVLLERLEPPKPTSSLIEVVSHSEEPSQFAKVVVVGTGVKEDIKVGDTVITARYVGSPIEFDDKEYFVAMETDIHAVMEA